MRHTKQVNVFQIALPFWKRVVFVDWHGVLCDKPFWHSILLNPSHRLHAPLKTQSEALFRTKRELVRKWMRGEVRSQEIVKEVGLGSSEHFDDGYLHKKLYCDCRGMRFDAELMGILQEFRSQCFLILATDNMDCFFESLGYMDGLLSSFDFVLCSSELGVLKSDGVQKFFGPWLKAQNIGYQQAMLIDDCQKTCQAFRNAGGLSVVYEGVSKIKKPLSNWFGSASPIPAKFDRSTHAYRA
jgi:FMN phosphatase YigB (HAD superfamily)